MKIALSTTSGVAGDRGVRPRTPRALKPDSAARRIQPDESAACEEQRAAGPRSLHRRVTNSLPHRPWRPDHVALPRVEGMMPALAPPMFAITLPPSTSGETAAPKKPGTLNSFAVLCDHSGSPPSTAVARSSPLERTRRDDGTAAPRRNRSHPGRPSDSRSPLRRPARRIERLDTRGRRPDGRG